MEVDKVSFGNDESAGTIKRLLDVNAARQRVGARNLANASTEGYSPKKVEFAEELSRTSTRAELTRTHPGHLASSREATEAGAIEVVDRDAPEDEDSRMELSVAELADAQMAYATAATLMSRRMATVRTAISGRP
jgi:flagellar basal-body rod protein FlgB